MDVPRPGRHAAGVVAPRRRGLRLQRPSRCTPRGACSRTGGTATCAAVRAPGPAGRLRGPGACSRTGGTAACTAVRAPGPAGLLHAPRCVLPDRRDGYAAPVRAPGPAVLLHAPRCVLPDRRDGCMAPVRAPGPAVLLHAPRCVLPDRRDGYVAPVRAPGPAVLLHAPRCVLPDRRDCCMDRGACSGTGRVALAARPGRLPRGVRRRSTGAASEATACNHEKRVASRCSRSHPVVWRAGVPLSRRRPPHFLYPRPRRWTGITCAAAPARAREAPRRRRAARRPRTASTGAAMARGSTPTAPRGDTWRFVVRPRLITSGTTSSPRSAGIGSYPG